MQEHCAMIHCSERERRYSSSLGPQEEWAQCDHNEHMFTASFFLPTVGTYLRRLSNGAYSGDFDIGEQFHHYMLHLTEQIYCGVHVPPSMVERLRADGLEVDPLMRWNRLVFGWQSSPYLALQMLARALEIAVETTGNNNFQIHKVLLNLPSQPGYDRSKPRLIKLRIDGMVSADIIVYFDDARVSGPMEEITQRAMRQVISCLQSLGNQDATQKGKQYPNDRERGAAESCTLIKA
jgi:hypothetical protein